MSEPLGADDQETAAEQLTASSGSQQWLIFLLNQISDRLKNIESRFETQEERATELKESFARVDERTQALSEKTTELSSDLRSIRDKMVTSQVAWGLAGLIIAVIGIFVALLYQVVTSQ